MASFDDTFAAELRALRPVPRPKFTAELDERAAAGFPRRPDDGGGKSFWERLRDWFAGLTPRWALLAPGGAAALIVVVVAVVVVVSQTGGGTPEPTAETLKVEAGVEQTGATESSGEAGAAIEAAPKASSAQKAAAQSREQGDIEEEKSSEDSAGIQYSEAAPTVTGSESAPEASSGANAGAGAADDSFAPRNRDIERSASIVLGTTPDKLSETSAQVYEAVHAARGVVLSSSVHQSRHGGEARFELEIPSGRLSNALATFSGIAEVRSRHDATADITAPTVSASEELQDSNARIEGLVGQLGEAESDAEREAVEGELRGERDHHAQLRASLERLEGRASLSRVSLRIISGHGAGVAPGGDSGSWGIGNAWHDAGHILAVAGGVAILGLAILGPIALILLAIWLLNRFRVRRLRERALG